MSLPSVSRLPVAPSRLWWTTIAVVLLLMPALASAQDVTEAALKAAFIHNFAKFTEWPADTVAAGEPFVLCVLGDAAVGEALARSVRAGQLGGHRLTVSTLEPGAPQAVCHVLYVSGVTVGQAAQAVAHVRDAPVLTISDLVGFPALGGAAQFFFDRGRLRFSVQLESVKRAHLKISSRLLALATPHE